MRLDPTVTTLAEFFSEFRALVEDGLTSNARQAYARAWTIRVEPTLGALPLTELRTLTIAKAKALWSGSEFADGQPLRFHDLRHTFLSRLARQGIAPAHIQKVAGHASITTTERYTHISGTEAALAVRDAINGANREVTFRGGESAANTGPTRQNPRKSGGSSL